MLSKLGGLLIINEGEYREFEACKLKMFKLLAKHGLSSICECFFHFFV